jgi:hypothetical protein
VNKIVLTAAQGMSGTITNAATLAADGYKATVSGTEGVTLDCGEEGVAIGGEAIPFHIAVPAGSYTDFAITVITTDGEVQTRSAKEGIEVARSSITTITLGFGELGATTGSADVPEGSPEPWVQLWPGGPKWAKFNVGSTIYSYAGVTEYTHPDVTGGYYSYRGKLDSTPNAGAVEDTATELWGENWATPTREQQQALLDNCEWTYCDGSTVQYEPGCTLKGWKASGKEPGYTENSIFLPLSGIRNQNNSQRETVGSRACFWSLNAGGSGAYFINFTTGPCPTSTVSANQPHGLSVRAICVGDKHITSIEDDDLGLYTDLSSKETANTYIVSAAGKYKFKATVKGNGGLDPVTGQNATAIDPSDISGATVLWELSERGRAIEFKGKYQMCYAGGYIYFRTPEEFVRGDAYVAIFKDGEGGREGFFDRDKDEILWSWLIWATEEPGTATHKEDIFMDRNIGAWGINETFAGGFAYQWGRPCPFSASLNKQYAPYPYYPDRTQAFRFEAIGEGKTVAYSTSHPETFFYGGRSCWMPDDGFYNNLWSDDKKTIYDPSPIGYKVPSKDQLDGITGSMWFYGTGFIGYGSNPDFGYGNPGSILLWSSTSDDEDGYRGAWANAYGGMTKRYGSWPDVYFASGIPIRCVKEGFPPIPGASNCHMITEAGSYSFDATVKGNGGLDPLTGKRATRIDKTAIAGVKVLWEVYDQGRAIRHDGSQYDISYADGRVTLRTPETLTSGAACVAVHDASDNILWSWMIWTTLAPGIKEHNGATFMDRNLGAVDAGNCMRGFLFQWGRKDAWSAANGGYAVYPYVPEARYVFTHESGPKSMEYATAHPTVYFRADGTWMLREEYTLKPWQNDVKSVYDPCPEGWRVPTSAQLSGISGMPDTGIGGGYDPNEYYKGFGNPGTGYYWSSSTDEGADNRAYAFVNDGRNIQHWSHDQGYAIRCVKE